MKLRIAIKVWLAAQAAFEAQGRVDEVTGQIDEHDLREAVQGIGLGVDSFQHACLRLWARCRMVRNPKWWRMCRRVGLDPRLWLRAQAQSPGDAPQPAGSSRREAAAQRAWMVQR
jgi:uncharacterized protein with von Willebrand factor type A (vWA) domain